MYTTPWTISGSNYVLLHVVEESLTLGQEEKSGCKKLRDQIQNPLERESPTLGHTQVLTIAVLGL